MPGRRSRQAEMGFFDGLAIYTPSTSKVLVFYMIFISQEQKIALMAKARPNLDYLFLNGIRIFADSLLPPKLCPKMTSSWP
jgi:hypothetical protein